jgi:hypothetical protein
MKKWLLLALVAAPGLAVADEHCRDQSKVTLTRGSHGEKIYRFDCAFEVKGKLPEALILLSRSPVGYDEPALELPLSQRIDQATRNEPF